MRLSFIAIIALLTPFLTSCEKKQEASNEKPPVVKGAQLGKVELSTVDDYHEASGTVRSRTVTTLASKIMGNVDKISVGEGDRVRAGQTLIEIDNRGAAAQLQKAQAGLRESQESLVEIDQSIAAAQSAKAAAEANLRLATATFSRYQALLERKSASPQEFDEAKAKRQIAEAEADRADKLLQTLAAKKNQAAARVEEAKAEIANAQIYVGYARIISPINGIVVSKQIEIGSIAAPGAPLLTIEDDSRYRLEAAVEESQIGKIRLGDKTRVKIDALGSNEVDGRVIEIAPAADPASRSYTVKIDLPPSPPMRSGLFGSARFIVGRKDVLTVPDKSIVRRGQLTGVYAVDGEGVARLRLIKTGKGYGDRMEVLSGLTDGERIVIDGVGNVTDGGRLQ